MTSSAKYVSRYDHRVNLIKETLREHSKLSEKSSLELAERILDVLNHVPENVR